MQVFKIFGKFEKNGKWSEKEADFIGYFVKRQEQNDLIEGYFEEDNEVSNDKIRYIKGIYLEDLNQLVFLKMINDGYSPQLYAFTDICKDGYWDEYDYYYGFFCKGNSKGHARVNIEEITTEEEKEQISKYTIEVFEKKIFKSNRLNRDLMKQVFNLYDFLKKGRYPKY